MFHHNQLPATPCADTRPVTTSGVSAANVVATIDAPASHHGTARPEMKYSLKLSPPFFVNAKPMPADNAKYAATMAQSTIEMCIGGRLAGTLSEGGHQRHHGIRERDAHAANAVVAPRRIHAVAEQNDEDVV